MKVIFEERVCVGTYAYKYVDDCNTVRTERASIYCFCEAHYCKNPGVLHVNCGLGDDYGEWATELDYDTTLEHAVLGKSAAVRRAIALSDEYQAKIRALIPDDERSDEEVLAAVETN